MGTLVVVIVFVAVVVLAVVQWQLRQKRGEELLAFAFQFGLEYSRTDIRGEALVAPFALFEKGDGRGVENFITGAWQGLPVTEFDYWYYDESTDSEGHRSKTYHYFSCAEAAIGAFCPHLVVGREDPGTWLAGHMGFHDIEFELEEFNRAFWVKCEDRKFANDMIDQRMMNWMLRAGSDWSFEGCGSEVLVYSRRRKPFELIPLLGALKGFLDHVPRVVYELYGPDAAR